MSKLEKTETSSSIAKDELTEKESEADYVHDRRERALDQGETTENIRTHWFQIWSAGFTIIS